MTANKVIVFGPTGDVASTTARTAQEQGAQVFLAMRDTSKAIPGLTPADESKAGFQRIQADLTQPESISSAVRETGAKTAFMYLAWAAGDHMKATFEASKAAAITFLVFLSSFTIRPGDAVDKIVSDYKVPYMHARAEIELDAVYGSANYVTLRPGHFAANTRRWQAGIHKGRIQVDGPENMYDHITAKDMGTVAGMILAHGQRDGQHIVYLYGPELKTLKDAANITLKALGKKSVTVTYGPAPASGEWYKIGLVL